MLIHNITGYCIAAIDMPIIERQTNINMLVICSASLVVLILLVFIKTFYKGFFRELFYSFFIIDNSVNSELTESSSTNFHANATLLVSAVISITTAIFTISEYSDPKILEGAGEPPVLIFKLLLFVTAYLIFKKIILSGLGLIYEIKKATNTYLKFIFNLIKITGVVIFPIYIIIPFLGHWMDRVLIIIILSIFIIAYIYKFIIFFSNSVKIKFFNHYSILYFCTFEILPVLFLLKLV